MELVVTGMSCHTDHFQSNALNVLRIITENNPLPQTTSLSMHSSVCVCIQFVTVTIPSCDKIPHSILVLSTRYQKIYTSSLVSNPLRKQSYSIKTTSKKVLVHHRQLKATWIHLDTRKENIGRKLTYKQNILKRCRPNIKVSFSTECH